MTKNTEPNKALEPTTVAVTECAPSRTFRASYGRGSSITLGKMKTALRISTAAALFILIGMISWRWIGPVMSLDVLLPQSVIAQTTPDQRKEIQDRIGMVIEPSFIHWIAISTVCIGNGVSLYILSREKKNGA